MCARIVIVEDEALIAAEIKLTLTDLGHDVVGHAMNGDKALDLLSSVSFDMALLDINIKGTLNGIDLANVIREKYQLPFLFITSYTDKATLDKVKETMPYGYIVKPFNEHDLRVNIELGLNRYREEQDKGKSDKAYIEKVIGSELSEREYDILIDFCRGKTYKEVAAEHYISINTVKTYQKRLYRMLNVSTKGELISKVNAM